MHTILIVDDAPENIQVLAALLEDSYEILAANSGEAALRLAPTALPDLVLLDVVMPGLDGYQVCTRLKADPVTAEIPVIFLTARTGQDDIQRGFEAGGVDYVGKPIQPAEIKARIGTHLRIRQNQLELEALNGRLADLNQTLNDQLEMGRIAQLSVLPEHPPAIPGVGVHALYRPVDALGGDFYDYFTLDAAAGRYGVFLCDITGHGVSAALFTIMLKTLINASETKNGASCDVLYYLNAKMFELVKNYLATACYAVIDSRARTIEFSSAGHCRPLLVRGGAVTEIEVKGPILAGIKEPKFTPVTHALRPGDRILLYTDGLIEETNAAGEYYETAALPAHLATHAAQPAPALLEGLYDAVTRWAAPEPIHDDICMIVIDAE